MIGLIMGSAFLFSSLLAFGAIGLLVEWIAYRRDVKERKKVKVVVWRLREKNEDWRRKNAKMYKV